jgi:hypothetical protein
MVQSADEIKVVFTDKEINTLLKKEAPAGSSYSRHFNQNEEFFISLQEEIVFPSLPIHHDVRDLNPDKRYLAELKSLIRAVRAQAPDVLQNMTYLFDPRDVLRPQFFQIYRAQDEQYLYLLRLDLVFKPQEHEVIEKGDNDITPRYRSRKLPIEALFIPLSGISAEHDKIRSFIIRQSVSSTWIGETGRGYFVQGIWMDYDLTKFFSKLLIPEKKRLYPYYPFSCKYRAICHNLVFLDPENRKKALPRLIRAIQYLEPGIAEMQEALRSEEFSTELPAFRDLKAKIPESFQTIWDDYSVELYLNERDMKEYRIDRSPV